MAAAGSMRAEARERGATSARAYDGAAAAGAGRSSAARLSHAAPTRVPPSRRVAG